VGQYDQLHRRFNPTEFDANQWVAAAKEAGMKYLVITSKHHDGFCIWDSQHTDYDITATPFGRDVLRELSDACKDQDIMFCTYHSICDWYHPDYPLGSPGGKSAKAHPNMQRYVQYLHSQTEEILRKYGPIGIMWFDGEWESPWTHAMGVQLYRHLRSLQPDILINNRVDKGRRGMQGMTSAGEFLGDYATPEQQVGGFNREEPWESCITIARQWAWKPGDQLKSLAECIGTLVHVVGGDGNLLLNVGPMPDGRIEPRQVQRLREIGGWLDKYGDGIYGTRGGPFKPGPWGASTCRDNKIFLFVLQWPADRSLNLPPIDAQVQSSRTLSQHSVSVTPSDDGLTISLADSSSPDAIATVLELTVEGNAIDIEPVDVDDRQ
jgi:alpha-L-fucosidase